MIGPICRLITRSAIARRAEAIIGPLKEGNQDPPFKEPPMIRPLAVFAALALTLGTSAAQEIAPPATPDIVIDPAATRSTLIHSLESVTRQASDEPFRVGVYQV